jgi:septum formation protein
MYHPAVRLVLASASPRRAEILTQAGFEFDVVPADIDERRVGSEPPVAYVCRVAAAKAAAIAERDAGRLVLAADSAVLVGDQLFGKPGDDEDAAGMLRQLSGRTHEVLTAVTLRQGTAILSEVVCTHVTFARLSADELAWYVASGEPRDKAGAYAIQGLASRFVERIEGSYSNVVGLPIATVFRLVERLRSG